MKRQTAPRGATAGAWRSLSPRYDALEAALASRIFPPEQRVLLRARDTLLPVSLPLRPRMTSPADTTELLQAVRCGNRAAVNRLFTHLYDQLHELAHHQLARGRPGETLNTAARVHELYLKLLRGSNLVWEDRKHFLSVAATAMRHLIVDHARKHAAAVHGGKVQHVSLDAEQVPGEMRIAELVALEEALHKLERLSRRLSHIVELLYFGGLSVEEAAAVTDTSARTVKRDMRKARAFLQTMLS